jgi:PAS domain S-box-containing protein
MTTDVLRKRERIAPSARAVHVRVDVSGSENAKTESERRICELELQQTRLKQQNQNLLAENRELRSKALDFFNSHPMAHALLDEEGRIQFINGPAAEILEQPKDKLLGQTLASIIAPNDIPIFLTHLRRCHSVSKVHAELSLIGKKGVLKPVQLLSAMMQNPKTYQLEYLTTILDASETLFARRNAQQRQQNYEALVNSIEGIVWEASWRNHRYTFVSNQAQRMLGFPAEWWIQHPDFIESQIHPEDRPRVLEQRHQSCLHQQDYVIEYRITSAGGRLLWLKDSAHWEKSRADNWKILGVTVDVTALKEAQLELQKTNEGLETRIKERTAELEENLHSMKTFCYSLAHDLRAPIRAMQGFSSALLEDYSPVLDAQGLEYAQRIVKAGHRMDRLITDLLTYGQTLHRDLQPCEIDLVPEFQTVLQELAEDIDTRHAKIVLAKKMPRVIAEQTLLHQVLTNLLGNALKFVAFDVIPDIHIFTEQKPGKLVRIWIEDNGIGIKAAYHEKLFQVFERLDSDDRFPGTGIGLALVKKGVERMGGKAGVESEPDKGSRFWIELPQATENSSSR